MIDKQSNALPKEVSSWPSQWHRFRLTTNRGRQWWAIDLLEKETEWSDTVLEELDAAFTFDTGSNPNSADRLFRALQEREKSQSASSESFDGVSAARKGALKGLQFYQRLQADDGHWPGDYGGPLFLLPGLVIASYITQTPFSAPQQTLMKRYMLNHQREDGGWGLHIEGTSTLFGTAMQYVALRLLGMSAETEAMEKARSWILDRGGATFIPSWGKFYLSVLGVYDWKGCQSLFPEMWTVPRWLPIHPGRYWCHARMVYLPMAYCYGHRLTGPNTHLIKEIRQEIYPIPYEEIHWQKARNSVAAEDSYSTPSAFLSVVHKLLNGYERAPIGSWRKKALAFILEYIEAEDQQTNFVDIGPVNQIINSICIWHAYGKESDAFRQHVDRWQDYLWIAEDGMKMNGYNGSQLWDTAFAIHAITEGGLEKELPEPLIKAYQYLETTQVREDVPQRERYFRHPSQGGWPFSTLDHGWPITDCTAEGLGATLRFHQSAHAQLPTDQVRISDERLFQAVDLILSFQNKDGGWATYENKRGPDWLEILNPSEIFGGIMVDYSYTECTSACIRALAEFRHVYPEYHQGVLEQAIQNGSRFIRKQQRADGSWFGSWAVCFTYGTWFGVEALVASGAPSYEKGEQEVDPTLARACSFLLTKQRPDGGWGESYESCLKDEYIQHEESQLINTSWALLALMAAQYPDQQPIQQGIAFLLDAQQADGDWPQQGISGVFNRSCMITYTAYRNIFPIWALSRYDNLYHQ